MRRYHHISPDRPAHKELQMNRPTFITPLRLSPLFALAALMLLAAAPGALAQTCGGGTVAPGDGICTQPIYCSNSITASGSANPGVSFSVGDTVGSSHMVIFSNTGSTGFLRSWNSTDNPSYFPGIFEICATRGAGHTTGATVQLCYTCD
jgi:hypothetical protein